MVRISLVVLVAAAALGCGARSGPDPAMRGRPTDPAASGAHKHACSLDVGQKIAPVSGRALSGDRPITFPGGRVTLVAFLERWNRFLERTVPHLNDLHARYRARGLDVILVDGENDVGGELPAFWQKHPVSFPVLWDEGRTLGQKLRYSGVTVALFDESGVVRYVGEGRPDTEDIDAVALEREARALLDHPRSTVPSYPPPACETQIGQRFPRAEVPRLDQPGRISIPSGKWTLVAIVASYSEPSKKALPALAKVAAAYRARGLTVVAVSIDEKPDGVVEFARASGGASLPIVFDEGHLISLELQPATEPCFILLDAEGVVRRVLRGYHDSLLDDAMAEIDKTLF